MSSKSSTDLDPTFVSYAADVIADTERGISGPDVIRFTVAHAGRGGIVLPHTSYPFDARNKRSALYENLMTFSAKQQYAILKELCELPKLRAANAEGVDELKARLIARYGSLAGDSPPKELDSALVREAGHFLEPFPAVLKLYQGAILKYSSGAFQRNVLDDLRLGLELLSRELTGSKKTLENQVGPLGSFVKARGGSPEYTNMLLKLVEYFAKYQNTYVKHHDAVVEEEIELVLELCATFTKHLVRLSRRPATE